MVKQETIEAIHARFKANSPNEVWLDVRRPDEWAEGVIPGGLKTLCLNWIPTKPIF